MRTRFFPHWPNAGQTVTTDPVRFSRHAQCATRARPGRRVCCRRRAEKKCSRDWLIPLRAGIPVGEITSEPPAVVDGEGCAREEPQWTWTELGVKEVRNRIQCSRLHCSMCDVRRPLPVASIGGSIQTVTAPAARSRSTSTRRKILPDGDFGICAIISSRRTRL